ncbi:4a-hydroxytetrahydrobiopterin dehydratase [Cryptosporangium minutisporangium]|uniref:Putative pterin-4-alpha-carbinolamine dehydratase n=1 Tax=Cryptosporangium minutisporangium TaxID=113569 RepID=A0ABP6SUU7_9ACTN
MADMTLSADEITAGLTELPEWSGDTSGIRRTVEAASFPAAIALVDRIAVVAEQRDHHPDIDIRWRKVTFALVTHSAGGVTAKDLQLAAEIDACVET